MAASPRDSAGEGTHAQATVPTPGRHLAELLLIMIRLEAIRSEADI